MNIANTAQVSADEKLLRIMFFCASDGTGKINN